MFKILSAGLNKSFSKIRGPKGYLCPDNIKTAVPDVRRSLLQADVTLSIAKQFVFHVEKRRL